MSESVRPALPGKPTSLWLDTTPRTAFPSYAGDGLTVDVAIVGGGIAGLTAATLLKGAGKTVAVLEAGRIVEGVTGFTTAKLTSLHTLIYDHLVDHFGEESARAYGAANQAAIEQVASLAAAAGIDCDFERTEAYTYTENPDDAAQLEAEVKAAARLGLPAALVTETPLPFPVTAAVRFERQARFHPRKYLLGLAAALPGDGSHVFEGTRVQEVEDGDPCTVRTAQGTLTARDVVIATHFPFNDKAIYAARLSPHRSYVVAVLVDGPVPPGMYITAGETTRTLRSHPYEGGELLLVGGEGHKTGQGGDTVARYERLVDWARERFSVRSVAFRWSTQDNHTVDRVPYVGRINPTTEHLYVATGFGGWGMTGGTVAGMILSDRIRGRDNAWADLYDPNRLPLDAVPTLVRENVDVATHFFGDRLRHAASEHALAPGEGALLETPAGKVAAYRSEDGATIHRLSPVCTHMGCLVEWNPAEKSWDCPCHGSRFAAEGRVIHGPANTDLERVAEGEEATT